jgi:hypothetical protein
MRDPNLENADISEHAKQAIGSVGLSYDEPLSPAALQDLVDTFKRIESGETTYDQEDDRLLSEWREAKARESINKAS